MGTPEPKSSTISAGMVPGMKGVHIGPGATAFTRIPLDVSADAMDRMNARDAPRVVLYPIRLSWPWNAFTLLVRPYPALYRPRAADGADGARPYPPFHDGTPLMLTLYGTSKTRALRPLWLLEELGLDYTHEPVPPHADALGPLSNLGKVPVLDADGTAITDSTAILTYLADREGRFTAPAGTLDRAEQDAMTFMVLDDLEGQLWAAAKHSFILPKEHRVPEAKASAKWEFNRNIDRLMERRRGTWLMGEEMTIPDILAVHCGGWAKVAKFETENTDYIDYIKQGRARDAFKRAAALP